MPVFADLSPAGSSLSSKFPCGPTARLPFFARSRGRVGIGSLCETGLWAASPPLPCGPAARLPQTGALRPPDPQGNSFCGERVPRKPAKGDPLAIPADRRTSRYAEHRRHGNAAVAQSRSAPTHANVRLSPNGRAGVFIRARQAEIPPLPRCREENSSHQGSPSRIKIPSRGTNVDDQCASSVGPTGEHAVLCGFSPTPENYGENEKRPRPGVKWDMCLHCT